MLQISSNHIAKTHNDTLKNNNNVCNFVKKHKDAFEKSCKVSFKGLEGVFKTFPAIFPKVEVLPGVKDSFVSQITKEISKFPNDWLRKFKKENYDIVISPTVSKAYEAKNVFDPVVEFSETQNPNGILGVTYNYITLNNKNFFTFCDKTPYTDKYMKNIVNHELSHGVVNIAKIDRDKKTFDILKKDVNEIIKERKLDKLTLNERKLTSKYFFNKNAYMPIDEIAADVFAWNNGAGFYGSGLAMNVENPKLMKNLFPNLSEYLKTI